MVVAAGPYSEEIYDGMIMRKFRTNIASEELCWHRDAEDRVIEVLSGSGWSFQYDDELPFQLNAGDTLTIPEGKYHKLHKGNTDLVILIERLQ